MLIVFKMHLLSYIQFKFILNQAKDRVRYNKNITKIKTVSISISFRLTF